jgi:hypothetical protein
VRSLFSQSIHFYVHQWDRINEQLNSNTWHNTLICPHIVLGCVFSKEVWCWLLAMLHLQDVVLVHEEDVMAWWLRSRKLVLKPMRKGFDSLVFLVGWRLWKERNARTFSADTLSADALVAAILVEAEEWCLAGFKQLRSLDALL